MVTYLPDVALLFRLFFVTTLPARLLVSNWNMITFVCVCLYQVCEEFKMLVSNGVQVYCIYGGARYEPQV